MRAGGGAPCVLNAANEVSVQNFLDGRVGFADIARINEAVLTALGNPAAPDSLADTLALDATARLLAEQQIAA